MRYELLGNIVDISKGKKHQIVEIPDATSKRIIGINDLRNDEDLIFTDDASGVKAFENDILIAWDGANAGTIGFGKQGYIGSTIARLRLKDFGKFHFAFVGKLLQSKFDYLRTTATGATIPHINRSALDHIKVPLFEISDQIRIATVLTRAERLIAKRKESIKALDELLKSTFLEMFGPNNPEFGNWSIVEVRELAAAHKGAMRTGPFGSNLLHSEFTKLGDVAVLGIDNAVQNKFAWGEKRFISKEKYLELRSYQIFPGDVIITIMGTIGRSAVIPDDIPLAINTKHLAAITVNRNLVNPHFLSYSIHSSPFIINQLSRKNRGAIMNGLNLGLIKEIKINKPPINLQNQFSNILLKVESIKAKQIQSLVELKNLYASLSQRAFKGELDLSRVVSVWPKVKATIEERHEVVTPEPSTREMRFSEEHLVEILYRRRGETLSFKELWDLIERSAFELMEGGGYFEELPVYDDIKKMIFCMLEGDKPLISQVFDEEKKEILLKVNE